MYRSIYIYIYMFVYIYIYVCVCVCVWCVCVCVYVCVCENAAVFLFENSKVYDHLDETARSDLKPPLEQGVLRIICGFPS